MKREKKAVFGALLLGLCLLGACGEKTGYPLPTKALKPTQPLRIGGTPEPTAVPTPDLTVTLTPEAAQVPTSVPVTGPVLRPTATPTPPLAKGLNLRLIGDAVIEVDRLSCWEDPGVWAFDTKEGGLSDKIRISGTVDTGKCGRYVLYYTVENGAGTVVTKERTVLVRMNKEDVEQAEAAGKVVYLTFDDGPSEHTDRLLRILEKYQVQATFFLCGTSRLKKQLAAGHAIGAHSATHDYSIYATDEKYFDDLNRIREKIYTAAGYSTWLVRFPGGSSNKVSRQYRKGAMTALTRLVEEAGYTYYDWNVSSGDAERVEDPEEIKQNVINGIKGQQVAVVLMHDSRSYTVDAVEDILLWGQENGYVFLPLTRYSRVVQHQVNN